MKNTNIKRGQIYFCDIPKTVGSVYHSRRPVLVISNNRNNLYSRCFTAVPISSRIEKLSKKQPTHVPLHTDCGLYRESIAMCENVCNYSKESLCDFIFIDSNVEVDYSTLPSVPIKKVNRDIMYDNLNLKKAREYYDGILKDKPPVISTVDICQITGYTNESVRRWISKGWLKVFTVARIYAIPKETFLDFLLSKEYNNIEQKSKLHEKTNLQLIK